MILERWTLLCGEKHSSYVDTFYILLSFVEAHPIVPPNAPTVPYMSWPFRQVYEKAEHLELLGSETPSKHVLQQLLGRWRWCFVFVSHSVFKEVQQQKGYEQDIIITIQTKRKKCWGLEFWVPTPKFNKFCWQGGRSCSCGQCQYCGSLCFGITPKFPSQWQLNISERWASCIFFAIHASYWKGFSQLESTFPPCVILIPVLRLDTRGFVLWQMQTPCQATSFRPRENQLRPCCTSGPSYTFSGCHVDMVFAEAGCGSMSVV